MKIHNLDIYIMVTDRVLGSKVTDVQTKTGTLRVESKVLYDGDVLVCHLFENGVCQDRYEITLDELSHFVDNLDAATAKLEALSGMVG